MAQRRELTMLAHVYEAKKDRIAGRLMSEKLDGQRAWWDGGISRGQPIKSVPYANTAKDARLVDPEYNATGLWTRYGKVIFAPTWFLDGLPPFPLDGELWLGYGMHQELRSIISQRVPDERWRKVKYFVFDWPTYDELFFPGRVVSGQIYEKIWDETVTEYVDERRMECDTGALTSTPGVLMRYERALRCMKETVSEIEPTWQVHDQERLPMGTDAAVARVDERMNEVLSVGGEGLILRTPHSSWQPKRTRDVLKVKPYHDSEATILGYTWGKKTDRGSRLLGLMGTLVVTWNDKEFELGSGFTNEERVLTIEDTSCPGEAVKDGVFSELFNIGSQVTFKYRDLSNDGIPKEATYFRRA